MDKLSLESFYYRTVPSVPSVPYLSGLLASEYLDFMGRQHPHLTDALDLGVVALREAQAWRGPGEFNDDRGLGRGDSYRRAQRLDTVREVGVRRLLKLVAAPAGPGTDVRILDVLGGDGVLARVWRRVFGADGPVPILTGDASPQMTLAAMQYGLPAICQPAQRLLVRDDVMNGVILAYGTHHLNRHDRPRAVAEACRVLRSGGKLVLHDFDEKSAVARWFAEVVDRYSAAGHQYDHFSPGEIEQYLTGGGFTDVRLTRMYDPFVATGETSEKALDQLLDYIVNMYGLRLLAEETDGLVVRERLLELVRRYFRIEPADMPDDDGAAVTELTLRRVGRGYVAILPRVALVGTGVKP